MTEHTCTHYKDKAFSTQSPNLVLLMQFMCVNAQSLQAGLTLCDPMDGSLPDSSVQGILQTAMLKWVAMLSSQGSSWPGDGTQVSCIAGRFLTTRGSPIINVWKKA